MTKTTLLLIGAFLGILLGWGAATVAHHFSHLESPIHMDDNRPFEIRIDGQTPWRELVPLLKAAGEQGHAEIRVNGAPIYLPCYSPYTNPHAGRKHQPDPNPEKLMIRPNDPLDTADDWIRNRRLCGTLVEVDEATSTARVASLARLLDIHRHTASWATRHIAGAEFRLTENDVYEMREPVNHEVASPTLFSPLVPNLQIGNAPAFESPIRNPPITARAPVRR